MSTPEDKVIAAAENVGTVLSTDAAKAKAWYKAYPFYAGLIGGAILCGALVHFLHL